MIKEYKNEHEKFIHDKNPNMVYADEAYYDFLIPINNETFSDYIKLEHFGLYSNGRTKKIGVIIKKGRWVKSRFADYISCIKNDKLYFGAVNPINNYIQKIMTSRIREKSLEPGRNMHNRAVIKRSPETLENLGLLKSIPISNADKLEEIIKKDYETERVDYQI